MWLRGGQGTCHVYLGSLGLGAWAPFIEQKGEENVLSCHLWDVGNNIQNVNESVLLVLDFVWLWVSLPSCRCASASPQTSIKEGQLLKQTSSFQRWKKRYFKLRGRTLYYAKDSKVMEGRPAARPRGCGRVSEFGSANCFCLGAHRGLSALTRTQCKCHPSWTQARGACLSPCHGMSPGDNPIGRDKGHLLSF